MKCKQLIVQSKIHLERNESKIDGQVSASVFDDGSQWMFDRMKELNLESTLLFDNTINYNGYGLFKYGISLIVFCISLYILWRINLFLLPLSVLFFYLLEVHFLFLFPILIDKKKNPLLTSIKATYRIGLLNCVFTVIPIGIFMVIGLLNYKKPLRNWYIGCLSILIWYQNEVRNWI